MTVFELGALGEFFGSLALVFGILTRLVTIPLAFTMCVAAFIVHATDPFQKQEFALLVGDMKSCAVNLLNVRLENNQ